LSIPSKLQEGQHVVVIANGDLSQSARLLGVLDGADVVVAADGGANWLASQGRLPDVLVGDMDSVSPPIMGALCDGRCRLSRHPVNKNETDMELALLEAVAMGARRITILGALGGRIDHALANILLLAIPQLADIEAVIYDGRCYLYVLRRAGEIRGRVGDTVSLIPLGGDVEGVVTHGLEYPLRDEILRFGLARGVSNVLLEPTAQVSMRKGILLVVHIPRQLEEERQE
jgi:thiamine pyrophosphokinase